MVTNVQEKLRNVSQCENIKDFLIGFLTAYGIPNASIMRLGLNKEIKIDSEISIGNKLFIVYTKSINLYVTYDHIQRNKLRNAKYRFICLFNDNEVLCFDTQIAEWLSSKRTEIYNYYDFFLPLLGIEKSVVSERPNVNVKIGEKFANLYNELLLLNNGSELQISCFVINLLAVLFSDSCGVLERGSLVNCIKLYTKEDGTDFNEFMKNVFSLIRGLNGIKDLLNKRHSCLSGLVEYADELIFDKKTRNTIVSLCELNWGSVEPEVIGALLQAILTPDKESLAYNYTSTANVYKVIGPLFIDDLFTKYEENKENPNKLLDLLVEIEQIQVFDPACGIGNFLIVCFKELVKLEDCIKKTLHDAGCEFEEKNYIHLDNFYGIENNFFATELCKLALAFTNIKRDSVLPNCIQLPESTIKNEKALMINWDAFCKDNGHTFIVGNPSYKGSHSLSSEQQKEVQCAFSDEIRNGFAIGELDYASAYFYKATNYIKNSFGGFAFVTTNSLTQGIHVPSLWPLLFSKGIEISFAHTSFKWKNEGKHNTAVTVVIIGCRSASNQHYKIIYNRNISYVADSISPYLTKGGLIVEKENKAPISKILPKMVKGNMPYGKGLLLEPNEKNELVRDYPHAIKYLKRVIGSEEFIHSKERWCLWISDEEVEEARKIPEIDRRIEEVRMARLSGDKSAQKLAERPHQFREVNMPQNCTLVVPSVSSENRVYMQIGYVGRNYVVTNLAFAIYDAEPWVFGIISSKMHNLWIRTVCGGLETRLRYSNVLGYNTFPIPELTEEQKQNISEASLGVIIERENNSEMSLMELYNEETMPEGLRYAHKLLDDIVEFCYKPEGFLNDQERIDTLFLLYKQMKENRK
jgi:hypothetical protein